MPEKFSLKDELFNPAKVKYLSGLIKNVYTNFDSEKFIKNICDELPNLELKQRIFCITKNLEIFLPSDFESALKIILKSLPPELDPNKTDDDFGDFILAPFSYFVVGSGLNDKYLELSLNAISELTKRFTCEDAIRFFINKYPDKSFEFMQFMANSNNYHQRRLASEGLRPKLPWCVGLDFDYQKSIAILDKLYFDKTRYVMRSVANHLNDIAKIEPNLVIKTLIKWQQENKQKNKKQWGFLVKHSLRTLIKKGDKKTLEFLGFNPNPNVEIFDFKIKNADIKIGEYLEFEFEIMGGEKLIIDYQINYPNNTKKVFKIKVIDVKKSITINKKHLFKLMTTKKLYSGEHKICLQINGKIMAQQAFILTI
jgi:3-methyladenine DNA glycosylase AlkC